MGGKAGQVTRHRQRRRQLLIQVLGGKCALCGYSRCAASLEFHHINPDNKNYQLSSGNCHELERDLEEAKKCILVCANCHREIHHSNLYDNYNLWDYQFYDYDLAKKALAIKKNGIYRNKRYNVSDMCQDPNANLENANNDTRYCSECGAPITKSSKTGVCTKCYHKRSRKIERPSREELKGMIRSMLFTEIGRIYGCTDSAIRKWCKNYKLPYHREEIDNFTDNEWELI